MKHHKKRHHSSERSEISESKSSVANMPQEVMMKPYPMEHMYLTEDLDDTIRGIERQKSFDHGQTMRNFMPKKV